VASRYISLIRHADYMQRPLAPSAYQPFPLTSLGEKQAAEALLPLQNFAQSQSLKIHNTIFCSTLLRAWQTADIIRQGLKDPDASLEDSIELAERSVGSVANLTTKEIEEVLLQDPRYEKPPEHWKANSHYCLPFPGAESLLQAGQRVADYIKRLVNRLADNELGVVVGHGASIRHAAFYLGMLEQDSIQKLSMYHCKPVFFKVPESDSDCWIHEAGDWKVRAQSEQPD